STALVAHHSENLEAYDLYLRGRYFFSRRAKDDIAKAIKYFRRAIAHDSTYALAYSGLADTYLMAGNLTYMPRPEAYSSADSATRKALALDDSLAEAHTSLARLRDLKEADWQGAEQDYRRAIALNPGYALAHSWLGLMLTKLHDRWDEAIREG